MTANPTLLSMPLAQNGQKNVIPETQATAGNGLFSQSTGFPAETSLPLGAGGVAPSREDFNGLANLLGGVAFMAQKGFTFNYDAGQDYYVGCVVIDPIDGLRYECIADMAVADTIAPHSDTGNTYWQAVNFGGGGGASVGFILPYAGTGTFDGWLDCDGSAVSRTLYADLFDAIGTTWGAGDGSTTFNLPRSEDLVLQGASTTNPIGTYKSAGVPNITGGDNSTTATDYSFIGNRATAGQVSSGAITVTNINTSATWPSGSRCLNNIYIDASKANSIYGNSTTVQPPAVCVRFLIKY